MFKAGVWVRDGEEVQKIVEKESFSSVGICV
jgi:hypothetical protein